MVSREGETESSSNSLCGGGVPPFWGRLFSNSQSLQFRADLRGKHLVFGRSSQCDVTLPTFLWISGEHFVVDYIIPTGSRKAKSCGCDGEDDDDDDDDDVYEEPDEGDDDDDDEPYVEIEDKSRNGTWLNDELIGHGLKMRAQDGDKITLRSPSRRTGRAEAMTLVLRVFNHKERLKQRRFLISGDNPINEDYNILWTLGEGQYSNVYEAEHKTTKQRVAVKVVSETPTVTTPEKVETAMRNIHREMSIMLSLRHPCCIQILNYIHFKQQHCFVLEMARMDLFEYIKKTGPLSEPIAQCLFVQMLSAIKYLHNNNVIHRDMKPENILLVNDGDCLIVKVTDFGLARVIEPLQFAKTLCGTPLYVSPEIIETNEKPGSVGYRTSVDMWSLGAILYTMLSATTPFNDADPLIYQHILSGAIKFPPERWARISVNAINVVRGLMTVNVSQRLTSAQCLATPWCMEGLCHLSYTHSATLRKLAETELAEIQTAHQRLMQQTSPPPAAAAATTSASPVARPPVALPSAPVVESGSLKRTGSMIRDDDDDDEIDCRAQAPPKRQHLDVQTSPVSSSAAAAPPAAATAPTEPAVMPALFPPQ